MNFPSAGSSATPAHPSHNFKWKDYCPKVRPGPLLPALHLRCTIGCLYTQCDTASRSHPLPAVLLHGTCSAANTTRTQQRSAAVSPDNTSDLLTTHHLQVFRKLRSTFGVDDAEYMLSLAGSQALRQLNTPGERHSAALRWTGGARALQHVPVGLQGAAGQLVACTFDAREQYVMHV
jgi:hypothetical protein